MKKNAIESAGSCVKAIILIIIFQLRMTNQRPLNYAEHGLVKFQRICADSILGSEADRNFCRIIAVVINMFRLPDFLTSDMAVCNSLKLS